MRPIHYIILILIILLIFGASRLPGVARSIGQSLKVFKHEVKDLGDSAEGSASDTGGTKSAAAAAPSAAGAPAPKQPADGPAARG